MKTIRISRRARLCGVTVALALFTGLGGFNAVSAQGTARGGATKLLALTGTRVLVQSDSQSIRPMTCGACKDKVVEAKANPNTQGAGAMALLAGGTPTRQVSIHTCPDCGTKWSYTGHGKAKVRTATHTCPTCGA